MKRAVIPLTAILVSGSAWAGSWDNYSESGSTAFRRDYLTEPERPIAGQPGVGDMPEQKPDHEFHDQENEQSILNDLGHHF